MASFSHHPRTHVVCLVTLLLTLCRPARPVEFAGGTSEPNDPYQIATAAQLQLLGSSRWVDRHFILAADIDCSAVKVECVSCRPKPGR